MNDFKYNEEQYADFLRFSLNATFKILPLFEKENAYLTEYIDSLIEFEFKGASAYVGDYSDTVWLSRVINTLEGLKSSLRSSSELKHATVKREVFKLLRIMNKELELLGEHHE